MFKKFVCKRSLTTVAVVLLMCFIGSTADEFHYEDQSKWYDTYMECSLDRQSPIELNTEQAELSLDLSSIEFTHYDQPYELPAECQNNGHTANIVLPKPKGFICDLWKAYDKVLPHITGGPLRNQRFVADSLHFHWGSRDTHGSEHVIDGKRFTLEMHIVHRNTKYPTVEVARDHADGLAVLAVIYSVQNTTYNYTGLRNILDALSSIREINKTAAIQQLQLSSLFGDLDLNDFFTYEGSLTTPPCSRAVTWIVFSHIIPISHAQMNRFHKLSDLNDLPMVNNYRSLQAKGDRRVLLRNREKSIDAIIESQVYWDLIKVLRKDLFEEKQAATLQT